MDGLRSVILTFDSNNILIRATLTFPRERYAELTTILADKYTLFYERSPTSGNKQALLAEGDIAIRSRAPYNTEEMDITYSHPSIIEAYNLHSREDMVPLKNHEYEQL